MSDTLKKSKKKSQKKKAIGSKKKADGSKKKADGSKKKADGSKKKASGKRKYTPQENENTAKKRTVNTSNIYPSKNIKASELASDIKIKLLESMHTQNWPRIHMAGNESTNQAIKACAISRKYFLRLTKQDIIVKPQYQTPKFRNRHGGKEKLDFYTFIVRTCDEYPEPAEESKEIFKVSSGSEPTKMAAAMLSKFIEGQHVVVKAIGKNAVNVAVKSIVLMRRYLKNGDDKEKDAGFCPSFFSFSAESDEKEQTHAMQFDIYECPKDN